MGSIDRRQRNKIKRSKKLQLLKSQKGKNIKKNDPKNIAKLLKDLKTMQKSVNAIIGKDVESNEVDKPKEKLDFNMKDFL